MEIVLDGNKINSKDDLFTEFRKEFSDLYGNNLDALWDVLTYYKGKLKVLIINYSNLYKNLGEYINYLIALFDDFKNENPEFEYSID